MTADAAAGDGDHLDELIEEFSHSGHGGTLAKQVCGCYVVDVTDLANFSSLPPHRKILLMVLLLCLKDQAGEVRFEPCETDTGERGLRLFYVVSGALHELVPPPSYLAPAIVRELKSLAGLLTWRMQVGGVVRRAAGWFDRQSIGPVSGGFRMGGGGHTCDITLTVHPSSPEDRIFLAISRVDPGLSQLADAGLRQLFEERRNGSRGSAGQTSDIA
ncbi:MAG: pilus assembly protein PilB [Planctomycetota bacterium]|nr:pilus assembly protein PilB [Planctomycetota bacterium]